MTHHDEPFIARLKQLESAWQHRHITGSEYHDLLDYYLRRLAQDEALR